jgi:hypothetical protein
MSDLIYRLRYPAMSWTQDGGSQLDKEETLRDMVEAADEIERLRAAQPQSPWIPIETAPFVSAKRYLIVNGSEIPLIGFRYYEHGPWYDEHGHEVNPLAWQELPSYSVSRPDGNSK